MQDRARVEGFVGFNLYLHMSHSPAWGINVLFEDKVINSK